MRRHPVLTAIFLVLVLVLTACGDGPATDLATTVPQDTQTPDPSATDTTAPPTAPPGAGPGGFSSSECFDLVFAVAEASSLGMMGSGDPGDAVRSLEAIAGVVPPAVAADALTLASAYADYIATLEAAGIDFQDPASFAAPEAQQALEQAAAAFEGSRAVEASERLSDYIEEVCDEG